MRRAEQESDGSTFRYLAVLRRRLWLMLLVAMATVWAGAVYSFNQETLYRASMKVVMVLPIDSTNTSSIEVQSRTLASRIDDQTVATKVIDNLGLNITPSGLMDRLRVVTRSDTAVLEVTYDDVFPKRAAVTLKEVGTVFEALVGGPVTPPAATPAPSRSPGPTPSPRATPTASTVRPEPRVEARVFDQPYVVGAVQPTPVRTMGVALVLGVLLGLMAGLVRELFDDTLREVEEAEEAFGAEAIATLPPRFLGYRPLGRNRRRRVDLAQAELAIQRLAANILWSPHSRQSRTLLVTSANPEEGKTTVAAHLAVGMASTGHRVVAVDTDLRRPMLHHYLGMEASGRFVGLDAVIRGSAPLSSAVVDVPLGNRSPHPVPSASLRAILASPSSLWPAEVGPDRIAQVLEELTAHGDYVILDSPPLLVAPDAYPLVSAVDTVVLVIRSGKSTAAAVAATRSLLERLEARRVEMVVTEVATPTASSYRAYASPRLPGPEIPQNEGRVPPT